MMYSKTLPEPELRIEELWNLTAGTPHNPSQPPSTIPTATTTDSIIKANLLVLDEQSNIFAPIENPSQETSKPREPWMRMALIKNPNTTYQAVLIERGRLVCETETCTTPYAAAMAMFDYTSVQVGLALAHARQALRRGQADDETVLRIRREISLESSNTADSEDVVMQERRNTNPGKPWGKNLTRLGSTDDEVYSCSRRGTLP